jgi:hypothetical protein
MGRSLEELGDQKGASHIGRHVVCPGKHVSLDQIESPTVGLIGQLKVKPTTARNKFATVFVDTFSSLSFVHLQQTTNAVETLEAKLQF